MKSSHNNNIISSFISWSQNILPMKFLDTLFQIYLSAVTYFDTQTKHALKRDSRENIRDEEKENGMKTGFRMVNWTVIRVR